MRIVDYHLPATFDEVSELLTRYGAEARVMGGGTALAILLKEGLIDSVRLVSLERMGLESVTWEDGALHVGAMTSLQALADHPLVHEHLPILSEVLHQVASRRIRNVATLGGNICWAEPASDPPGILMLLDAEATIMSGRGERRLAMRNLFRDYYTTALEPDEVLTAVRIPPPRKDTGVAYIKFTPQSKADKPVLGVAASIRAEQGACADARVVVGAAGPAPLSLPEADAGIRGQPVESRAVDDLADRYAEAAQPVSDGRGSEGYKRDMIRVLVRRALRRAWAKVQTK
jgi:carbon-monoxide dehydrogenase medium subunit